MSNKRRTARDSAGDQGNAIGNPFYGCAGHLAVDWVDTNYKTWLGKDRRLGPGRSQSGGTLDEFWYRVERHFGTIPSRGGDHFANFLAAARARATAPS